MTWRTHAAIGSNSIWLAGLTGKVDESILILFPAAFIASLLPDIDAAGGGAKIHYMGGGVLSNFKGMHGKYFHHRGILHSVLAALIFFSLFFWLNYFLLANTYPLLPYVFALSYISHPVIDGFNFKKVGYFYPFSLKSFSLLPQPLLTRIKGFTDNLLFIFGIFGILLFFLLYANEFTSGLFI
jgi:membrane-bound metal-dependent hydrolase YbcI (DUF457 family)